jgi:hypothetical protein
MTVQELATIAKGIAPAIQEHLKSAFAGVERRLTDIEQRAPVPGPKGDKGEPGIGINGKDADPIDLDAVAQKVAAFVPAPKDGKDGSPGEPGTSFTAGDGAPLFDGRNGDVYLDAKTGDLYQCV